MTPVYLEEIVLFNERIINMITKSMGEIMVLYLIITIHSILKTITHVLTYLYVLPEHLPQNQYRAILQQFDVVYFLFLLCKEWQSEGEKKTDGIASMQRQCFLVFTTSTININTTTTAITTTAAATTTIITTSTTTDTTTITTATATTTITPSYCLVTSKILS